MKGAFFSILCFLLRAISALAVPANSNLVGILQKDSSMLHVRLYGDEYFHFYLTSDYLFVAPDTCGRWCYMEYENGEFFLTQMLAHDIEKRDEEETSFVKGNSLKLDFQKQKEVVCAKWNNIRKPDENRRTIYHFKALQHGTYFGKKKGLVILVDFSNKTMKSSTAQKDFYRMFNEPGYSENNHVGSVSDYFRDQSYGKFQIEFDVVGPISLPNTFGYYGTNGLSVNHNHDKNAHEMIYDACLRADKMINYSDYDWDADGKVDQVFVVYAGYGEATGGPSNTIWPHESELHYYYDDPLVLDNVIIDKYACSNELYTYTDTYMGIGTACHEFSHCLGLPDLYDTEYTGAFGMSYWSVMNSGSYSGPTGVGEVPCGYTAFERWYAGWLEFTDAPSTIRIENMRDLGNEPVAYRIQNEGNNDEFYTIEYRNGEKWFGYAKTYSNPHGLLITHIDYDSNAWIKNRVNLSPKHQRMSPILADNQYGESYADLMGDLFPGLKNVVVLDDSSHVETGGILFTQNRDGTNKMGITVNQIVENEDRTASFNIIFNNDLYAPKDIVVSELFTNGFGISWEPVAMAESYSIEISWLESKKPYVKKVEIINDITEHSFKFEDLSDNTYNYRVRANRENISTEWSPYNSFDFKVQDIVDALDAVIENGNHCIYDLLGKRISYNPKPGIYIVKRNGTLSKILKYK